MRLFVGIELGQRVAASVEEAIERLRAPLGRSCPDLPVRWVSPANLHVTLVFIGEVGESDRPAVIAALEPPVNASPFNLRLSGFGAFPASGALRVIWMPIVEGAREAAGLHDEIEARLTRIGRIAEARTYTPHLTVARVKDARGAPARIARDAARTTAASGGTVRVEAVTLFRSRLSAHGAAYEPLMRLPLLG